MDTTKLHKPAQLTALLLSTTLSGASLAISTLLIPRLLESPTDLMLRQWLSTYTSGRRAIVPLTLVASSAYFYLSFVTPPPIKRVYGLAGALCFGIVPYTVLFMRGTNGKIMGRVDEQGVKMVAKGEGEGEGGDVWAKGDGGKPEGSKYLVDWWATLNFGRGVMLFASSVVGLTAALW
ncbi:hypothetical protein QBC47DRAFT_414094 [Echria macrotheca]|uniref:DUF1772-domain-containing protein n=1 Tax=Echria macrotheca TaxID=438768 RepID=A0AAJ0BBE9_9PEZI|nr:hypothetical protein QBC47DRAFT_414094 [Echria macrotheca]